MTTTTRKMTSKMTTECGGWRWCNWCEGQPGGCEFCDGAGKRGCPCRVGDLDGNRWEHGGQAGGGKTCAAGSGGCGGEEIHPFALMFRRADDPTVVADEECVIPAYGAAPKGVA